MTSFNFWCRSRRPLRGVSLVQQTEMHTLQRERGKNTNPQSSMIYHNQPILQDQWLPHIVAHHGVPGAPVFWELWLISSIAYVIVGYPSDRRAAAHVFQVNDPLPRPSFAHRIWFGPLGCGELWLLGLQLLQVGMWVSSTGINSQMRPRSELWWLRVHLLHHLSRDATNKVRSMNMYEP